MKRSTLRCALGGALFAVMGARFVVAASDSTPAPPAVTKAVIGTLVANPNGWAKIEIVDVKRFPWDGSPGAANKYERFSNPSKTFFNGPNQKGAFIYSEFAPSFSTKRSDGPPSAPHYHPFWEMGYTLRGDSVMMEPLSPDELNPMYYHKKEGGWMTRPPGGLHGGGIRSGKQSQMPYYLLLYEEGDGSVITLGPSSFGPKADQYQPDFPGRKPDPYVPDWKAVKDYAKPYFVDTIENLEWADDPNVPGRFVKWIDDSKAEGFRSQLVKIPPGWKAPPGYKEYFESANRLRYMIWGDMKVWSFSGPADVGKAVRVQEDGFIYQPPRSIWGYGTGSVSDKGAIWLEMTWAKGLTHGGGPIEQPKIVH